MGLIGVAWLAFVGCTAREFRNGFKVLMLVFLTVYGFWGG